MRLLREMGYTDVRYYFGGLEAWREHGQPLDSVLPPRASALATPAGRADVLLAWLDRLTARWLFGAWLAIALVFGVLYWLVDSAGHGLREGSAWAGGGLRGLLEALYFSFVTALSIGYGDVVPAAALRALAILEGGLGLMIFGVLVSKLVNRRQEALTAEIHRVTFEERLGRVRTNLHLVLSDFQTIAVTSEEVGWAPHRIAPRLESASAVLAGELRTVHDLLYHPQQAPEEEVFEGILASLAGVLREYTEILSRLPNDRRSPALQTSSRTIRRLSYEICSDCVPPGASERIVEWMNDIQALAFGM